MVLQTWRFSWHSPKSHCMDTFPQHQVAFSEFVFWHNQKVNCKLKRKILKRYLHLRQRKGPLLEVGKEIKGISLLNSKGSSQVLQLAMHAYQHCCLFKNWKKHQNLSWKQIRPNILPKRTSRQPWRKRFSQITMPPPKSGPALDKPNQPIKNINEVGETSSLINKQ